ncbi:MAG: polysaccharide biosynthesis C-terminal domain-containing protein, partial [Rhodocyclaceae bacterium]|nr:polysaccharide biosynthesis C-terminal domain-containing protein [Rhodocyclaceae bacterium]
GQGAGTWGALLFALAPLSLILARLAITDMALTFLLTLPAALALAILAVPLLATLFQHGAFTASDVLATRQALVAYSVGLIGLILVKVLAPGFYAQQNIKTPVKIALVTLVATQAMNLAFIVPLKHAGLALSIGLASCLNAALLFHGLRRRGSYRPQPGWLAFAWRLALALAVLAATLFFGMGREADWLAASALTRVLRLCAVVMAGLLAYFATLWLLGFRLADFRRNAF